MLPWRAIVLIIGFCSIPPLGSAQDIKFDFVGDPLPKGAVARFGSNRLRHDSDVTRLIHTASGKIVSIGGGIVAMWDGRTGKELLRIDSDERICRSLAVSGNERFIAGGGDAVLIWDANTGKLLKRMQRGKGTIYDVDFSPDGARIVSADGENGVSIWDTTSGQLIWQDSVDKSFAGRVGFAPDGRSFTSSIGTYREAADGQSWVKLPDLPAGSHYSPDGKLILQGIHGVTIRLYDAKTGDELRMFQEHRRPISSAAFSPDGNLIASTDIGGNIRIWDPKSGIELWTIRQPVHEQIIQSVAFSPDGQTLSTGHGDGRIRLWNPATEKERIPLLGHDEPVKMLTFPKDGKHLVTSDNTAAIVWDVATGKRVRTISDKGKRISSLAFRGDDLLLSFVDSNGTSIRNSTNDEELVRLPEIEGVFGIRPQGEIVSMIGKSDQDRWITNHSTEKAIGRGPWGATFLTQEGQSFVQKNDTLVRVPANDNEMEVQFRYQIPELPKNLKCPPFGGVKGMIRVMRTSSAVVSPDGKILATLNGAMLTSGLSGLFCSSFGSTDIVYENSIQLWDMSSGRRLQKVVLEGPDCSSPVRCLAFSPDSRTIAGAGRDGGTYHRPHLAIQFWNVETGKRIHQIEVPRVAGTHEVTCIAFAPDGKAIATAGNDWTAMLWELPPEILPERGR